MTNHSANEVVVVSGLPRSGTSMMMRMLEAGGVPVLIDEIRVADEDNPNGYYEFEAVKKTKEDASWLQQAPGKVVKMVYQLLYDLPPDRKYRVVFMRRKLDEVLASQKVMLQRNESGTDEISDETMAALFRRQLGKFEEWIAEQPNFAMLEVSYNDVLSDAAPVIGRINAFLGGELDESAMCAVVDGALYRNRR